jgi:hypothetical protein
MARVAAVTWWLVISDDNSGKNNEENLQYQMQSIAGLQLSRADDD